MNGKGPLSSPGACSGLAHMHTPLNTEQRPDIQAGFLTSTGSRFSLVHTSLSLNTQSRDRTSRQASSLQPVPALVKTRTSLFP